MLNVFVKQFDLVALFTYFHAQQVAHREHSYPTIAIDNWEMSTANQLHAFEGLVRCFIALDHGSQLAGHVANFNRVGITFGDDDAIHDVTLGKDAEQLAVSSSTQTAPMFLSAINSAASCTVAEALVE